MKKFLANVLSIVMISGLACGIAACGTTVEVEVDKDKTQLYIGSYNGGGGYKWLDSAKERFEEKYADTSFEDGKTGVQVIIEHAKSYTGDAAISSSDNDLFFVGSATYYDLVSSKSLMDITDVVTEVNTFDNKTIESKFNDETKNALKVNEKYYALPYYEYFGGITYDSDLFNNNRLYFSNSVDNSDTKYPGTNAFVTVKDATNLSCGPDALYGTYDDGLPSTYQEFYKLMDKMIKGTGGKKITPFAFPGGNVHYTNFLLHALAANYVGADGWGATFDFDSNGKEVEIVTGFKDGKPTVVKEVITEENAYKLKSSLGLYYASEFCSKVFTNSQYYDTTCASETSTNLATQERFMKSGWDSSSPTPIAMLIEGSYWYNESQQEGIFERAAKLNPYGNNEIKNVKFMPLPHQYEGTITPKEASEAPVSQVLVNQGNTYAIISANTPSNHVEVAKLFLAFCYSDDELEKAELSNNGIARGLNYSTSNIQSELSPYAKNLNEMRTQAIANNTVLKSIAQNDIYIKGGKYFALSTTSEYWMSTLDIPYANVYTAFYSKNCSGQTYFEGLAMSEDVWRSKYYN